MKWVISLYSIHGLPGIASFPVVCAWLIRKYVILTDHFLHCDFICDLFLFGLKRGVPILEVS